MSTKWTLNIAAMQEEFFSDTALIGIVSALPAYRFCWMLNQKFDMDFVRDAESDICLQNNSEEKAHYFPPTSPAPIIRVICFVSGSSTPGAKRRLAKWVIVQNKNKMVSPLAIADHELIISATFVTSPPASIPNILWISIKKGAPGE